MQAISAVELSKLRLCSPSRGAAAFVSALALSGLDVTWFPTLYSLNILHGADIKIQIPTAKGGEGHYFLPFFFFLDFLRSEEVDDTGSSSGKMKHQPK